MQQKLKTIFINLLIITIPIIFIGTVIYIYRADDIVQVKTQTYIQEPLTVTENHIQISNLKASYETYDESNIYGELIMLYQLSNGEDYQDKFSLEQIHNKQLPDNGSVLTKTYYKGTYVLRSGKTVTLETTDKLKKATTSIAEKTHYISGLKSRPTQNLSTQAFKCLMSCPTEKHI